MTQPGDAGASVRIERVMRAPPERVFQAFLDPELIRQWMNPGELVLDSISVDARVGGKILITHSLNGESSGSFQGEFVKIAPNTELVYRWAFVGTEPEKGEYFDTLVTVTLLPVPVGRTRVTVLHERLEDLRARAPDIYSVVGKEWNKSLDQMEIVLEASSKHGVR